VLTERGRFDEALAVYGRLLGLHRRGVFRQLEPLVLNDLAALWLRRGDATRTREVARESLGIFQERGLRTAEASAHLRPAEAALLADGAALAGTQPAAAGAPQAGARDASSVVVPLRMALCGGSHAVPILLPRVDGAAPRFELVRPPIRATTTGQPLVERVTGACDGPSGQLAPSGIQLDQARVFHVALGGVTRPLDERRGRAR
jgi:hypothetical protein